MFIATLLDEGYRFDLNYEQYNCGTCVTYKGGLYNKPPETSGGGGDGDEDRRLRHRPLLLMSE